MTLVGDEVGAFWLMAGPNFAAESCFWVETKTKQPTERTAIGSSLRADNGNFMDIPLEFSSRLKGVCFFASGLATPQIRVESN
jgi:hypothetical protein